MRILHIIDSGGLYGAEVMLLSLIDEQIKLGLDPTIASIGEKNIGEKPLEAEALKRGFKVNKFRMRPCPNIMGAHKILQFAHQDAFDLMHSHGYKGNILFGFVPKKVRKLPLVSTIHGYTSTNAFTKMRLYEWLDTKSLKFIDVVVLVSNAMKSHPRLKSLNGNNIHVIPNGIPIPDSTVTQFNDSTTHPFNQSPSQFDNLTIQQFDRSPIQFNNSTNQPFDKTVNQFNDLTTQQFVDSKIIKFCEGGFTIGSIGRLSTEKGYRYLIETLELLVKGGIDARLVIIGEGSERDYLEGLVAQFGLSGRVMLPGYRDDAKRYVPYFNAFAISSLTEGLPITLLEAMQAKIPVVATKVGGIPEVLQNGKDGLIVEPRDSQSLARALSRIYHDLILCDELTNLAYQKVITDYTSEKMALQYIDIYHKLCRADVGY